MIDIPIGKALMGARVTKLGIEIPEGKAVVAVELEKRGTRDCRECVLFSTVNCYIRFACNSGERKDGKKVIFRKVDLLGGGNNGTA